MDMSIDHFRSLWTRTNGDLDAHCETWEKYCGDDGVPEEVQGEIRTAIGLARLLKGQKLKQFNGLIDDSEFKTGEKEVSLVDLQGFWDMVYTEVEKINNSFKKLEDCKRNDWKIVEKSVEKVKPKKAVKKVLPKKTDQSNSLSQDAKKRLAEVKKRMKAQQQLARDPQPTNLLDLEKISSGKSQEDAPSPRKMAKTEAANETAAAKPTKKAPKRKANIPKTAKNKPETSAALKKTAVSKKDKENTPANAQISKGKLKTKETLESLVEKKFQEADKRITRSARRAMLAELTLAHN